MPIEISHRRGSISLCECELERPQVLMALDCDGGEPGRNRTFNPQIKSLLLCQLSYWPTSGRGGILGRHGRAGTNRNRNTPVREIGAGGALGRSGARHVDARGEIGYAKRASRWRSSSCRSPRTSVRHAPVAQLDRAAGFEPVGRGFKSLRARHSNSLTECLVHRADGASLSAGVPRPLETPQPSGSCGDPLS
jgi:hypothetical protein